MDDEELTQEFVRVQRDADGAKVLVGVIYWEGAYNPRVEWECARVVPLESSDSALEGIVAELLGSEEYFAVCDECGMRNPLGWMSDDSICQSCAVQNHGVVY